MRDGLITGTLPEADGHHVAWEVWGNPAAMPILILHGGPGGGISDGHRALFDPAEWRIVAMDQRGCGRSRPHAGADLAALEANTTAHLIADIERLRAHLSIAEWVVFGGSWGASLAQAYAHAHRAHVLGLLLVGVTQTRRSEIDWLYGHVGQLLPEAFAPFADLVPKATSGVERTAAYLPLLRDADTAQAAAEHWCAWEAAVVDTDPRHEPSGRWADPVFRLGFARLCAHYFSNLAWMDPPLDERAASLGDLPGEMLHSAMDLSAPVAAAWRLARDWPGAALTVLPGALHSAGEAELRETIRAKAARLRARVSGG